MKKHSTIPIFVPHLGCPHDCVFCNQKKITGKDTFSYDDMRKDIESYLATIRSSSEDTEIAFFGGSFTGIDRDSMIAMLEIAGEYVRLGKVSSLRCSTRPDYIDDDILELLKKYGMKTVELGVQSMSDSVLEASMRGHTSACTYIAAKKIIDHGMDFVGQMMIGLPTSTPHDEIECAKAICNMGAVGARIYPTAVFAKTALERLTQEGLYTPLTLNDACARSVDVLDIFVKHDVKILRIGLCESDTLHDCDGIVAGANHPALGEMCISEYYYKIMKNLLSGLSGEVSVFVPVGHLSKVVGQKGINRSRIYSTTEITNIKFIQSKDIPPYHLEVAAKTR